MQSFTIADCFSQPMHDRPDGHASNMSYLLGKLLRKTFFGTDFKEHYKKPGAERQARVSIAAPLSKVILKPHS